MKVFPAGSRVRRFGTIPPVPGVILDDEVSVGADGGPRQRVQWQLDNAPISAWDPALLMPLDTNPNDDPDEVVSGEHVWRHPRLYPATAQILEHGLSLFFPPRLQATPVLRR